MRVVLDLSSCAKRERKGIANYGAELVRAAEALGTGHELVPAVRPHRFTRRHTLDDILPGRAVRLLLERLHRPFLGGRVDLLHAMGARLPAGGRFVKVATIHDLNVFEFPELSSPEWLAKRRRRILQTVERADWIVADSSQGRDVLCEVTGFDAGRVRVVPLGVDVERFRPRAPDETAPALDRVGVGERPYVLCIGSDDGRKNHAGLLEAFARCRLPTEGWRLVLAGPRGDSADALRARAVELALPEGALVIPGWIEDDDLPLLMAGAGLYACASHHEGFGLPVLEAQACGVPVASSDRAALPETLGDVGVLFDPADLDAFAAALDRVGTDETLRAELSRRGPERVRAAFTWETVARRTVDVWEQALA